MYEDIFESIRKEAAKRNLRESTANAYCNSVGYFLRTVNKVPMELTVEDVDPEYQLPEPPAMMSARSYKTKFVEPLVARFKSLISTLFARYFKALDSYHRLNITNGNLYRENEKLSKVNEKLSRENENLRAENRDYKLLRKVFGHKQIDNLLDRAKSEKQSIQRSSRFRNYKDER